MSECRFEVRKKLHRYLSSCFLSIFRVFLRRETGISSGNVKEGSLYSVWGEYPNKEPDTESRLKRTKVSPLPLFYVQMKTAIFKRFFSVHLVYVY